MCYPSLRRSARISQLNWKNFQSSLVTSIALWKRVLVQCARERGARNTSWLLDFFVGVCMRNSDSCKKFAETRGTKDIGEGNFSHICNMWELFPDLCNIREHVIVEGSSAFPHLYVSLPNIGEIMPLCMIFYMVWCRKNSTTAST